MDGVPTITPVAYQPALEQPEPDEAATTAELVQVLRQISETTYKDSGEALRSVHAKSHGVLKGQLEIPADLPPMLRQGLFGKPGRYAVAMRLSTTPGDLLDDKISTPRGLGLKVLGVEGERLPGSEGQTTQDFVLVNGPAFQVPSAKAFLKNLKLLAGTTDKAQGLKKALSAIFRGTEKVVESLGGESATLKSMGGHPQTHILGETFFSQAPLLFGSYMAKASLAPVSPELTALTNAPVDLDGRPDGLRQAVKSFFAANGGVWELRVQLCTDTTAMPIEDSSVPWPEDQSPYVTVGRITLPPQDSWNEAVIEEISRGMSFSPWHGLAAHRPLGSIMRVRKSAYEMSAQLRASHGGCPVAEPRQLRSAA
jgi:hypothetical protein